MEKIFGSNSYSKLSAECGDVANEFFKKKSDLEEIFIKWGNLARSLGKLPTTADWTFSNNTPTADVIRRSHNLKWVDLPYKFLEFHSNKNEWHDVITLVPQKSVNGFAVSPTISKIEGLAFKFIKYIPPIVQDFVSLSTSEESSLDFEKKQTLYFKCSGLK